VQQAAQAVAQPLREQGTRLELDLPDSVPTLRADADRLTQVLLNLLGNAAKFVPQPGGLIRVRLSADALGLTVQVHDNGPGVPADQRSLIFERFQQGGDANHRPSGTGLGLPISRQIVEHFGGRIGVRADAGQGACFEFTLPWVVPKPTHENEIPETSHDDEDIDRRR
jgi:signal transduction histidine kinase